MTARETPPFMTGQVLGHYRVLERIGTGGMGEVYRARDEHLDRDVALKLLPADLLGDESARRRFRNEALALARLNHPNIAIVHDFDTYAGVDVLVTEVVPGQSLDERLAAGPLPEKEVLRLGEQLAEGLAAAHAHGVVHRDLKPANLRVTREGRLKILDFGLARLLRPAGTEATTESFSDSGVLAGTLPYMAPEQLRAEPADARADIWSAGAVLYEMASGRRPFEAKVATALAADIQHKPVPPPRQLNPKLSPRLEEIILKCLEKNADNRYQSAKELAVDLRRLAQAAMGTAAVPAVAPAPRRARSIGLTAVAASTVVVLALTLNLGGLRERLWSGRTPKIDSLAVLPLKNLSGDARQEYFAEGIHEALITELSKISALKVISHTSTIRYKDTDKPMPQIARELGVEGLIEGSVLRDDNQVRITVQLVHGPTDRQLWADSYQRELSNILSLQSEVVRNVADKVRVQLTPGEQARIRSVGTVNPEAHEAYLLGRHYFHRGKQEGYEKAIEQYQRAIAIDAYHAVAYLGLADAYASLTNVYWPPQQAMPKAKAAALRAIELDSTLADAYAQLGYVQLLYDYDWASAEQSLRRALELNPNSARAHQVYGAWLATLGRFDEAVRETRRGYQLDPLSRPLRKISLYQLFVSRRYAEIEAECRKALELDPTAGVAHAILALSFAYQGKLAQAEAEAEKVAAVDDSPVLNSYVGEVYALAGKPQRTRAVLRQLVEVSRQRYICPYHVATVYLSLGEKQQAFAWLEKGLLVRSD